jgi:signal transduction histidine kinase
LAHRRFQIYVAQPLEEFDESIDGFRRILLLLAPVFLLLSSLGGFWISRRALAPVDRIRREARSISVRNLSIRLPLPPAHDELRRLTETLNEMLDRIDTEVKRIVQFTADASHELRTPLTLIQTAAEFSLRRERRREELIDALGKILRESNRTARLVDELLLLARADSGTGDVRLNPVDVTATCRRAYEEARTLADSSNVALSMKLPNAPIYCNGDEQALERLWPGALHSVLLLPFRILKQRSKTPVSASRPLIWLTYSTGSGVLTKCARAIREERV